MVEKTSMHPRGAARVGSQASTKRRSPWCALSEIWGLIGITTVCHVFGWCAVLLPASGAVRGLPEVKMGDT